MGIKAEDTEDLKCRWCKEKEDSARDREFTCSYWKVICYDCTTKATCEKKCKKGGDHQVKEGDNRQ